MFDQGNLTATSIKVSARDMPRVSLPGLLILGSFHTGSTYFFDEGADFDIVVWVYDLDNYHRALITEGWTAHPATYTGPSFTSYRRGAFNLLVTNDSNYYKMMMVARATCKTLADWGLLSKEKAHRVEIHRAIQQEYVNV